MVSLIQGKVQGFWRDFHAASKDLGLTFPDTGLNGSRDLVHVSKGNTRSFDIDQCGALTLPHTTARTAAHCCRSHCHTLPLALSHCRTARTAAQCRTVPHSAALLPDSRTLPRTLPHTVSCAAVHCCAHCHTPPLALPYTITLPHTATHCRAHCHRLAPTGARFRPLPHY